MIVDEVTAYCTHFWTFVTQSNISWKRMASFQDLLINFRFSRSLHVCIFGILLTPARESGTAFYLLVADWPQSRRSPCTRDCPHVQDWSSQVWDHCPQLDTEICHGMTVEYPFQINWITRNMYKTLHFLFLLAAKTSSDIWAVCLCSETFYFRGRNSLS